MQSEKTYTSRSNARRAAIKAGVPADDVEIVSVGKGDDVRFGWKRAGEHTTTVKRDTSTTANAEERHSENDVDKDPTLDDPKPANLEPEQVEKPAREPREERNGVKRPRAGGKCAAVWDALDAMLAKSETPTLHDARDWAERTGANVSNAPIEFYQWRRWIGLSKIGGGNE